MFALTETTWHECPHACCVGMKDSSLSSLQHWTPNAYHEAAQENAICQTFTSWPCTLPVLNLENHESLTRCFPNELHQVEAETTTGLEISYYLFRREWECKRQACGGTRGLRRTCSKQVTSLDIGHQGGLLHQQVSTPTKNTCPRRKCKHQDNDQLQVLPWSCLWSYIISYAGSLQARLQAFVPTPLFPHWIVLQPGRCSLQLPSQEWYLFLLWSYCQFIIAKTWNLSPHQEISSPFYI